MLHQGLVGPVDQGELPALVPQALLPVGGDQGQLPQLLRQDVGVFQLLHRLQQGRHEGGALLLFGVVLQLILHLAEGHAHEKLLAAVVQVFPRQAAQLSENPQGQPGKAEHLCAGQQPALGAAAQVVEGLFALKGVLLRHNENEPEPRPLPAVKAAAPAVLDPACKPLAQPGGLAAARRAYDELKHGGSSFLFPAAGCLSLA